MILYKNLPTLLFLLLGPIVATAQSPTQTIRGQILDADSKITLPGANVIVLGTDPILGTSTDMDGQFKIENVPVGRHHIQITFLGYQEQVIPNVLLESGKQMVLTIELVESLTKLKEVEITAKQYKSQAMNEMATVSAKAFSVEETQRYAASIDDPGRMALSYAGVTGGYDGMNEIVIRGNSPKGLLWRLEGLEIPNPNHFSEEGSSGGGVSALSSNMMTNSDFFTGAFPAEYGNAASGVFDIRLRKGNNEQREYALQLGFLGSDFAFEGPFKKGGRASYLVNYRYSTLAIMNKLGVDIVGDAVPVFQDLNYNISLPTKKHGHFTLFGMGGLSSISDDLPNFRNNYSTDLGVTGATHTYMLNKKTYLKTVVAWTGTQNNYTDFELDQDSAFYNDNNEKFINQSARVSLTLNKKFNARHTLKAGIIYSNLSYDYHLDYLWEETNTRITEIDQAGNTSLMQGFVNWKYRITEGLTFVSGLHYMQLTLNNNMTFEPRVGMRWNFAPNQSLNAGFGIHSRHEALTAYFARNTADDGTITFPNHDLNFSKARHFVLGYDNMLRDNLFLKMEVYYQDLYDVPVDRYSASYFSIINFRDGYSDRPLANEGTGRNYGVELTLEKYFSDNYYFLITGSVFDSKYTASDNIERNTRFNSNYAMNVLAGKEFVFGSENRRKALGFSVKSTWVGGQRLIPIDLEASIIAEQTVRDYDRAFEEKGDEYFRTDIQISFRKDRPKATHILKLDVQNVTNRLNTFNLQYDNETQLIRKSTHLGLIPILSYKVKF
jgi:hypothetical protein